MDFAGYQIPYWIYFLNKNMPSITLSKDRIKLNKACFSKLKDCEYIELLYHPIYQAIIIRRCDTQTETAVCCKTTKGKLLQSFRAKAFMEALYERMNWLDNLNFNFVWFIGNAEIHKYYSFLLKNQEYTRKRSKQSPAQIRIVSVLPKRHRKSKTETQNRTRILPIFPFST